MAGPSGRCHSPVEPVAELIESAQLVESAQLLNRPGVQRLNEKEHRLPCNPTSPELMPAAAAQAGGIGPEAPASRVRVDAANPKGTAAAVGRLRSEVPPSPE